MSLEKPKDYRELLQVELMRRIRKNPRYSLRSFAEFLEMNSGSLSQILRGQRSLGKKTETRINEKLALSPSTIKSLASRKGRVEPVEDLSMDVFSVISDWYHFAIIELIDIHNGWVNAKLISQRLGISTTEATMALERLATLNIVEGEEMSWQVVPKNLSTLNHPQSEAALRQLQKTFLQKAMDALENVAIDKRDHSSLTAAVPVKHIPEVKEKITNFRREMNTYLMSLADHEDVYNLTIAFFPLTEKPVGSNGDIK